MQADASLRNQSLRTDLRWVANETQIERKLETWVDLRVRLASALAMIFYIYFFSSLGFTLSGRSQISES